MVGAGEYGRLVPDASPCLAAHSRRRHMRGENLNGGGSTTAGTEESDLLSLTGF